MDLVQNGGLNVLIKKFVRGLPKDESSQAQTLQTRQVGLVFAVYSLAGAAALAILVFEIVSGKIGSLVERLRQKSPYHGGKSECKKEIKRLQERKYSLAKIY